MLLTDTYRNKTLKMLAKTNEYKESYGPSLKFKKQMLDRFLKMLEDTASKMKNKPAVEFIKQRRDK